MTPETRAARDRLAAYTDALSDHRLPYDPKPAVLAVTWQDGKPVKLMRADLRLVLAELDEEPPSPPDTGKLCCCGTGTDCPACLTGRCYECPDNPERERDDDWDDEDWQQEDDDD